MFTIRSQQIEAFEADLTRRFQRELAAHIRDQFPDALAAMGDKALDERIAAAVARARGYGMTTQASAAAFVALTFAIGPRFDDQPTMRRVLSDSAIAPDDRIDALMQIAAPSDWLESEAL